MNSAAEILANNLNFLMGDGPERLSQAAVAKGAGLDQRTIGRILNKEHSPAVAQVEKLATFFGKEMWQLMTPALGADLYRIVNGRIVPVTPEQQKNIG